MEQHADELAGEPASPIEVLLEEFMAERNKTSPDPAKLEDIRNRMRAEHALVEAQNPSPERAARHQQDKIESEILNEREDIVNNITKTRLIIEGFEKDIRAMADEVIGDMAEEYPERMAEILDNVADIRSDVFEDIREVLDESYPDAEGVIPLTLLNEQQLMKAKGKDLMKIYGLLLKARNELIDEQSAMLKAVTEWRQERQAK